MFEAKTKNIIMAVTVVAILAGGVYLYFSGIQPDSRSGGAETAAEEDGAAKKQRQAEMVRAYEDSFKPLFSEYAAALDSENKIAGEDVDRIKAGLLELKVPAEFKNLHLDFMLALVKMRDLAAAGRGGDKAEGRKTVSRIKADYLWLN